MSFNRVPYEGWFAESSFPNTVLSQPIRRFYGSVKCSNVAKAQPTIAPVAWYANQVTMIANPGLAFLVNTLTTAGGVLQTFGPFPANVPIIMPAAATSITVFDAVGLGGALAPLEVLFELDFTLSF